MTLAGASGNSLSVCLLCVRIYNWIVSTCSAAQSQSPSNKVQRLFIKPNLRFGLFLASTLGFLHLVKDEEYPNHLCWNVIGIILHTGCLILIWSKVNGSEIENFDDISLAAWSQGLLICVSSPSFQKNSIGWPQQPLTERVSDISEKFDFWWSIPQKGTSIGHFGASNQDQYFLW